ncbi:MAG: DUF4221 family protein [Bacteroidales bacterium]|jgi:hypothetical protein|nr:DUF4221 domain-containing protein [Bacteroidales bacterium]MDD3702278.1 DUF4221 family protein [Bacteroidales bacterium]MDY0369562.1 DUF4221 family protein [Bacteroidales bacterium]
MTLSTKYQLNIYILLVLIVGCDTIRQPQDSHALNSEIIFYSSKTISLTGDYEFRNSTNYQIYYFNEADSSKYLVRRDKWRNRIEFFNLDNQKLDFVMELSSTGPDGIGKLGAFTIVNFDSIYLFGLYRKTIFLMDTTAKVKDKYYFNENDYASLGDYFVSTGAPMIRTKHKVFSLALFPAIDMAKLPEAFYKSSIHVNINIDSNFIQNSAIRYPAIYLNNNYAAGIDINYTYRTYNDLNFTYIFSFPVDPHIYVETLDGNIEKHYSPSQFFDFSPPAKSKNYDWEHERLYYIQTPKYLNIVYDKYRNVYYRFCQLPVKYEKGMYLPPNVSEIMPFSIMVLDENFTIIGEQLFAANQYIYTNYFINEEGLWMSASNPENPYFNENKLSFELLTIDDEILAKTK